MWWGRRGPRIWTVLRRRKQNERLNGLLEVIELCPKTVFLLHELLEALEDRCLL